MSKKILSVVLAIVLVFTVTATAFAAASVSYEDKDATYTQSWALGEPKDNGNGTWSVAVKLTANYPVMSFAFQLSNTDATNVTLKSAVVGKDIPNDETKETFWNATVKVNPAKGRVAINPNPIDDAVPAIDCSTEKEIAVLTYTVADGKSADVAIVNDAKTAKNGDGTLVAARSANNNVVSDVDNPIVGQKVESVGSAVTLGSAAQAAPELVLTEAGAAAGVIIDTAKTFGGKYAGVVYGFPVVGNKPTATYYDTYLQATNGGTIATVKTPYVSRPASYGTGTTIQLKDASGNVVATYVVVILGDVSGNGVVGSEDMGAIFAHIGETSLIEDEVKIMAANVVCSGRNATAKAKSLYEIKSDDTGAVFSQVADESSDTIGIAELAVAHNTYNTYYQ